jgi:hypothetical protein
MADRSDSSGGIFSLGRKVRGTDVGVGAEFRARGMSTDLVVGRILTDDDIGHGVEIPEPVNPTLDAYSPYGAAWKEFDGLQKAAKGTPWMNITHWWFGGVPGLLSVFDPHKHARPYERAMFLGALILAVAGIVRARLAALRLAHWTCPRCHSEWPGKKLEKDPRCAVCGLKLHQLMP